MKATMQVHISVDDVTGILRDITVHHYSAVFENPILADMYWFYLKYGAKFSLYCFADQEILLSQVTDRYREELAEENHWLKFGFHAGNKQSNYKMLASEEERACLREQIHMVQDNICRFAHEDSVCHTVRLHFFAGSKETVEELEKQGISALLAADDDRISYYLTEEENRALRASESGFLQKGNMKFYRTDIRYEKTEDILAALEARKQQERIVIFTHEYEWIKQRKKIETSLAWMKEHGAQFLMEL